MATASQPPTLITVREISKLAQVSGQRIIDAIAVGLVRPDFVASSGSILFHPDRVSEIKTTMSKPFGLERAIAANVRAANSRKS